MSRILELIKENLEYDYHMNYDSSNDRELFEDIYNLVCEFAKSALDARKEELKTWKADDSCKLEETLFFYPVIGMLNNLAREMAK